MIVQFDLIVHNDDDQDRLKIALREAFGASETAIKNLIKYIPYPDSKRNKRIRCTAEQFTAFLIIRNNLKVSRCNRFAELNAGIVGADIRGFDFS